jgi:hypothetical protein
MSRWMWRSKGTPVTDASELTKAIGAHGEWKRRLATAISTGTDVSTPAKVRSDSLCAFGEWLYKADTATATDLHYAGVKDLHGQFHQTAADVLILAIEGRKDDAEKAMAMGSHFAAVSAKLTNAMMAWRNSITG